uniref:Uncharacterized protein n=1 Tax=Rhodnius prolixus TaxID=13249 RepID=T1HY11_RHOPR
MSDMLATQVMIADSDEDLQQMIDPLNIISNNYGIKINSNKTKFMIVSRWKVPYTNAQIINK